MIECMTLLENIVIGGCLAYVLYRILRWFWKELNDTNCTKDDEVKG